MSFLQLENRNIVVMGVANRRSVAWAVAKVLRENGANILYVFKDKELMDRNRSLVGAESPAIVCDVENEADVQSFGERVKAVFPVVHGYVHSIAFANYSEGMKPFHETLRKDFLQAVQVSCFSLVETANQLKGLLSPDASIVTISISTTRMASENYGYMGPIKAALDSSVAFLAKSLNGEGRESVRVNAVGPGLLKTSSSAGIPGYIDAYLYAEQVIPRKRALETEEPANVAAFLLSPRSSGVNAQTIVVDAGMSVNYFDRGVVRTVVGGDHQS
ncbi:MAG: SDR family oxidoreductase [Lentisphaeria bacterium]|nr:SDR family oxidoreductase [Lentisphaeria bacterium]